MAWAWQQHSCQQTRHPQHTVLPLLTWGCHTLVTSLHTWWRATNSWGSQETSAGEQAHIPSGSQLSCSAEHDCIACTAAS